MGGLLLSLICPLVLGPLQVPLLRCDKLPILLARVIPLLGPLRDVVLEVSIVLVLIPKSPELDRREVVAAEELANCALIGISSLGSFNTSLFNRSDGTSSLVAGAATAPGSAIVTAATLLSSSCNWL